MNNSQVEGWPNKKARNYHWKINSKSWSCWKIRFKANIMGWAIL